MILYYYQNRKFYNKTYLETGNKHPRFEEFIGDYLAVAISDVAIFNSREEAKQFIGAHAGMTEKEMMVPLIVVEKK
jgi:hypothetical protein